ncbi:helix-turn-helix domain-containing protein [Kitasatospora sp. NPDC085895]|uniref:helix-turn-helix domain-containing protein n=1 Tax=Kitasatospora sp. NPDC085895 TaxID=3155057 RepID=UPI00344F74E6
MPSPPELKPYLSAPEIAQALNCSVQHVYNLIGEGRLAAIDIGVGQRANIRVDVAAFEAFLTSAAVVPASRVPADQS